jgi:hypothetical protein
MTRHNEIGDGEADSVAAVKQRHINCLVAKSVSEVYVVKDNK